MTIKSFRAVFIIASLVCVCPSFSQSEITKDQWRDSLATLNQRIIDEPYSSDLYLRKAAVNLELEQWANAIDTYSDILVREPDNPAALFYRAYANSRLRRYELARVDYDGFLDIYPQSIEGRLGFAYVLGKLKRQREAMDNYNQLVEMAPDKGLVYASRAGYEAEIKYYDLALYDWDQAISVEPSNYNYIVSKADLLIKLYRLEEAKECLDLAVERGAPRGELVDMYRQCK